MKSKLRDFQLNGRSPLRVADCAVATSHPLASVSALNILKDGGNAIDAAVAAAAVLAVVEPQSTGIGGDGFMLYAPKGEDKIIGYNGSGRAPARADVAWFQSRGIVEIDGHDPHSVTVPGVIDMWAKVIADHGSRDLEFLLQDAIGYAEQGYVVADRVSLDWHAAEETISHDPTAAHVFKPNGRLPIAGEVHRQPMLAQTLRKIAREGRDGFYRGEVAADIVGHLRSLGGLHSMEDFAQASGEYVEPISSSYRGNQIHQIPPNNQGITTLMMLNILEEFDFSRTDALSAERLHMEIEAGRLAFDIRNRMIGDPRHAEVNTAGMLDKQLAKRLSKRISMAAAATDVATINLRQSDTVYLSVVDRDRNAVSFINSIYHSFGSGIMSPNTGVLLQNRGMSFRIDPAHPNCIAPGKRPLHTIMPGMVTRGGKCLMPYGVMGGDYQPFGHVHVLQNILDFGMDPQAALDLPRVFASDGVVDAERGIAFDTCEMLRALGHVVVHAPKPLGGGQAIWIDHDSGTLTAGSDPRKDGCAIGC